MTRRALFAALILALGALITLVNLRDGIEFSFPLLLGVLLLADGVLRLVAPRHDRDDIPAEPG